MHKLKKVELTNFQSHKHTVVNLTDGLNVFMGQSRQGKTAIIRALRWLIANQPKGDFFIHQGEQECHVVATFETDKNDVVITRSRTPSFNGYYLDDKPLQATKGGVPEEVQDFLKMTSLNWQFEHDGPFLLNETPGEVAKQLNEIADLEDIDLSLGNLSSWLRRTNSQIKNTQTDYESAKSDLNDYKYLDNMKDDLYHLEEMDNELPYHARQIDNLENYINDLTNVKEELYCYSIKAKGARKLKILEKKQEKIQEVSEEISQLEVHIERLKEVEKEISEHSTSLITEGAQKIQDLICTEQGLISTEEDIHALSECINQLKTIEQGVQTCQKKITNLKKKIPNQCPTCGTLLNK